MTALSTLILLMYLSVLLVAVSQKIHLPYPISLVLGGSILGFIPGLVPINFDPKVLLIIVLPPILFYASYNISFKEFVRYFSDIFSLAIILVIITTAVVAILFKGLFPEISWPLAIAFGAIVSPPDAVSATAILKRFSINSRLGTILEGESLINDASALVIYKFSVVALVTGNFYIKDALVEGAYAVIGGIIIGFVLGYLLNKISSFLSPVLAVVYSFITPYITYVLADFVDTSGVLAVVVCGLWGARVLATKFDPLTRVLGWASWDIIIILLNCFVFMLIGLELKFFIDHMTWEQMSLYSFYGIIITAAMVVIRFIGVYGKRALSHLLLVRKDVLQKEKSKMYFSHALITSWAGMRGIVSLTAALALPYHLPDGTPVHGRDLVIFLTFEIIFLTLVVPGVTLPILINWLQIPPHLPQERMLPIRQKLASIATYEIHKLHLEKSIDKEGRELLEMYFVSRHKILEFISISEEHEVERARHIILQRQREHLMEMWRKNLVDDELMSHLERELDIEEAHLARGYLS